MGFLLWEIRVAFPGESQLRQIRATQPRVHAGCFSVSIVHRTLTWTTGSLTCAQMKMHAIAHGCTDTVTESELDVDSEGKISCRTAESNLRQGRAGPVALPTELHPHPQHQFPHKSSGQNLLKGRGEEGRRETKDSTCITLFLLLLLLVFSLFLFFVFSFFCYSQSQT